MVDYSRLPDESSPARSRRYRDDPHALKDDVGKIGRLLPFPGTAKPDEADSSADVLNVSLPDDVRELVSQRMTPLGCTLRSEIKTLQMDSTKQKPVDVLEGGNGPLRHLIHLEPEFLAQDSPDHLMRLTFILFFFEAAERVLWLSRGTDSLKQRGFRGQLKTWQQTLDAHFVPWYLIEDGAAPDEVRDAFLVFEGKPAQELPAGGGGGERPPDPTRPTSGERQSLSRALIELAMAWPAGQRNFFVRMTNDLALGGVAIQPGQEDWGKDASSNANTLIDFSLSKGWWYSSDHDQYGSHVLGVLTKNVLAQRGDPKEREVLLAMVSRMGLDHLPE